MIAQGFSGHAPRAVLLALVAALALAVVACDEPRSSTRPSASLLDVEFTPQPTSTAESSGEPTEAPTFVSLPVGWDGAFCAVFAEAVLAQELVIDVERALDDGDVRDARGLARELREVTAEVTTLLADLPDWDPGQQATLEVAALIDLGSRSGDAYGTYFVDGSRQALRRARTLRREISKATPGANENLAELEGLGITCEGLALKLEEF